MSIKQRLADDMKSALKAGEKDRLGVLRMLRSRIQEAEVAGRGKQGADYQLTDEEIVQALSTYAKQRRDSITAYREAGRDELASREEAELAIVRSYLPEQLSEEELKRLIGEAIAESGASSPAQMGAVMKAVMPRVQGRADGKLVNRLVRELLS